MTKKFMVGMLLGSLLGGCRSQQIAFRFSPARPVPAARPATAQPQPKKQVAKRALASVATTELAAQLAPGSNRVRPPKRRAAAFERALRQKPLKTSRVWAPVSSRLGQLAIGQRYIGQQVLRHWLTSNQQGSSAIAAVNSNLSSIAPTTPPDKPKHSLALTILINTLVYAILIGIVILGLHIGGWAGLGVFLALLVAWGLAIGLIKFTFGGSQKQ